MSETVPESLPEPVTILRERSRELHPLPTDAEPKLSHLPGIRALVFDVYGTLIQSAAGDISLAGGLPESRNASLKSVLTEAGYVLAKPEFPFAETLEQTIRSEQDKRRVAGITFPEVDILVVWERLLETLAASGVLMTDKAPTEALLRHLSVTYEIQVNPVWPMPGLEAVISTAIADGLHLGIVSNAQWFTPLLFEAFLGKTLTELGFEDALSVWSYRLLEGKPSTRLYERLCEQLDTVAGIPPEAVLYVGNDKRNDIAPAHRTGLKTALFAGDARSLRLREGDPLVTGIEPDCLVSELAQLPTCWRDC